MLKSFYRIRLQSNEIPELGQCFNNNERKLINLNIYNNNQEGDDKKNSKIERQHVKKQRGG